MSSATAALPSAQRDRKRVVVPLTVWDWLAFAVFGLAALGIALGGFRLSFAAVSHAMEPAFGHLAYLVPLIIDLSILVFSGLEVVLTRLNHGHPLLRLVPLAGTAATIWLNVSAGAGDAASTVAHIAMPSIWVAFIETARHVVRHRIGLATGTTREGIPAARWFLDPVGSLVLWRRMRLWEVNRYDEALAREVKRLGAYAALRDVYGRRWRSKTSRYTKLCIKLGVMDARDILGEEKANELKLVDLPQLLFTSALASASGSGQRPRRPAQQSGSDPRKPRLPEPPNPVLIPAQQGPGYGAEGQRPETGPEAPKDMVDLDARELDVEEDDLETDLEDDFDSDTLDRQSVAAAVYKAYQKAGRRLTYARLAELSGYSDKQAGRLIREQFRASYGEIVATDASDDGVFASELAETLYPRPLADAGQELQPAG